MEIKILNQDNLKEYEINEVVTRVKVFLINHNNEILIANCGGCFMLPGGHVEDNESLISTLKREILEETGIELEDTEITKPSLEVRQLKRNHRNTGKNRMSKVVYYIIRTNKTPDLTKLNLTEHEKINNFQINFIDISNFESTMQDVINSSSVEINRAIAQENINAFKIMEKQLKYFN